MLEAMLKIILSADILKKSADILKKFIIDKTGCFRV